METGIPGLSWDELRLKGFKVHELSPSVDVPSRTGRRDFYKMGLVEGSITINHDGLAKEVRGTFLFFVNPKAPHSVVTRVKRKGGYACIFTESFISAREIGHSPLLRAGDNPVIPLNPDEASFMRILFEKMLSAYNSEYPHKADLIKSCINLVIHQSLLIQPSQQPAQIHNGAGRIARLFTDLLEKQFPIERPGDPLKLRNPRQFAANLAVHVNYLNRAVKQATGKPTSVHISARIISEAKSLLQHTDWSTADIAFALGFEYPAYFNNYFKRSTGTNPTAFRKV